MKTALELDEHIESIFKYAGAIMLGLGVFILIAALVTWCFMWSLWAGTIVLAIVFIIVGLIIMDLTRS